ncbi:MAG: hypothetical protein WDO13_03185 [Verrucomicrobiota bacterium]
MAWIRELARSHPQHQLVLASVVPSRVPAFERLFARRCHVVSGRMCLAGLAFDYPNGSRDVNIVNNICVAEDGKPMNSDHNHNQNVLYDHNLMFGGRPPVVPGLHTIVADPRFVHPNAAPVRADFKLQPGSPAHGGAITPTYAPIMDLTDAHDPWSEIDLGAFLLP